MIGALDNFEARLRLNLLCWIAGVDWINAAIDSRYVTVESFPFAQLARSDAEIPACYECGLPPSVYQRIAERYSCGGSAAGGCARADRAHHGDHRFDRRRAGGQPRASHAVRSPQRWLFDSHSGLATRRHADTIAGAARAAVTHPHAAAIVRRCPASDRRQAIDAAARAAGAESIRLSDALIWECDCANCGATDATRAVELRRAAGVSDAITFCMQCRSQAIRVQIRDEFEPGELSGALRDAGDGGTGALRHRRRHAASTCKARNRPIRSRHDAIIDTRE